MHFELILAERENTNTEQGFRGSQYMLIPNILLYPGIVLSTEPACFHQ